MDRETLTESRKWGRSLLSIPTEDDFCVSEKSAVEEFPPDFMTQEQRMKGGVIFHITLTFYMFGLLAVVCDDYFVISLYHICSKLNLRSDVAGATFMAIGSSAPTLFIAVVSIFFTESGGDVGLGTVVGSTIFNTLFIVAVCGLAAGGAVSIGWYPLLRDSFMYILGTATLIITIRDRQVHWFEAIVFVIVYAMYILVMYLNPKLEGLARKIKNKYCIECCDVSEDIPETSSMELQRKLNDAADSTTIFTDAKPFMLNQSLSELKPGKEGISVDKSNGSMNAVSTLHNIADDTSKDNAANFVNRGTQTNFCKEHNSYHNDSDGLIRIDDLSQFEHKQESPFKIPPGIIPKIVWILGMPVVILFYLTIPPCCKRRWSEWYLITFLMSVLWMGALSYILVWMVCIVGDTFSIPDCVMGMTFLAAGSSIPDVMASVIVIRQGEGDMALSNAIGSNVFDMLCLGIPWLLKTGVMEPNSVVYIQSKSIMVSALLLIGSISFLVLAVHFNEWKLDGKLGFIFLIVYLIFISLATLVEFVACPCQIEV